MLLAAAVLTIVGRLNVVASHAAAVGAPPNAVPPSFEADVRPILKAHCFHCHGDQGKVEGGLDLRLRRLLVRGGESGPAVVPERPSESLLVARVSSGEMPPGDTEKLSPKQVDVLARWIAAGAKTVDLEPEQVSAGFLITNEDRRFWSFQPVRRPAVPQQHESGGVASPIDSFLLQPLRRNGERFSPEADRRTLVRRAYFDLVGLPPTMVEMSEALSDKSNDWYEKLVDRLLASPHYGERWGRHWLDIAGYADSDGYTPEDPVRDHMFHYRDYVIRAFNADKPFDEFVREQLAGDEMLPPPPFKNLTPEQSEKLAATGFLLMAPNPLASRTRDNPRQAHDAWMSETIKIVSTSLLGLSIGCAQCHDHRYDPISQEDYYRFRAIFEPALDLERWRVPRQQWISLFTDADRIRAREVEERAKEIDRRRNEAEHAAYLKLLDRELGKVPEVDRAAARAAHEAPAAKRTPEQRALLRQYPRLAFTAANLAVFDRAAAAEVMKIADEATAVRASVEKEGFIAAITEMGQRLPKTYLLFRGDFQQPRTEMKPDELSVLKSSARAFIPVDDLKSPSSGRRTAYARYLTDGDHPLFARVFVNRVWHHHFGRGLCATTADFGRQGERPSHPELLDWLAREFVDGGWSVKALHRSIMTSAAYRQSDRRSESLLRIDPENRLLGGFELRRIEAEVLRDSILAVSGKLNAKQFGPPVPVMRDPTGEIVVGIERVNAGLPGPPLPLNGEEYRRSIYVQVRRSRPLTMLQTFDAPTMEPNCAARSSSTVAPQSLMLLNNSFVVRQARHFAERVRARNDDDARAQVVEAWQSALLRTPTEEEIAEAIDFLSDRAAHFRTVAKPTTAKALPGARRGGAQAPDIDPPAITLQDPEFEALALLCQTLLSCNEFLYVD